MGGTTTVQLLIHCPRNEAEQAMEWKMTVNGVPLWFMLHAHALSSYLVFPLVMDCDCDSEAKQTLSSHVAFVIVSIPAIE